MMNPSGHKPPAGLRNGEAPASARHGVVLHMLGLLRWPHLLRALAMHTPPPQAAAVPEPTSRSWPAGLAGGAATAP